MFSSTHKCKTLAKVFSRHLEKKTYIFILAGCICLSTLHPNSFNLHLAMRNLVLSGLDRHNNGHKTMTFPSTGRSTKGDSWNRLEFQRCSAAITVSVWSPEVPRKQWKPFSLTGSTSMTSVSSAISWNLHSFSCTILETFVICRSYYIYKT